MKYKQEESEEETTPHPLFRYKNQTTSNEISRDQFQDK